jgi:general secretion pathway protein D
MTLSNQFFKQPLSIIVLSLLLTSCASLPQQNDEQEEFIKPDTLLIEESIIAKSTNSVTEVESTKPTIVLGNTEPAMATEKVTSIGGFGALERAAKTPPIFKDDDKVSISVDGMTVVEFIHYVFDELLDLNYVISTQLQSDTDKVSLNLKDPVDKDVLYTTSEQLLAENEIAILRKDEILYFQKRAKNKRYKSVTVGIGRLPTDVPESTGKIVQIIPYVYTNSSSLSSVITKLTGVKAQIDGRRKIVMVEGTQKEVLEVMRVLRMLDTPAAVGVEIRLIDLAYIAPDDLIEQLKELLENDGFQVGKKKDITLVSMPRLGAIVVYAVSLEAIERVELWSKKLDVAVAGDEPQFYVYRPLFNKAIDIQASLGQIINSILGVGSQNTPPKPASKSEAPANNGSNVSVMSVDEVQNALIFYTTADKYRKIMMLMDKLDKLPGQVILDIVIAEVTLSDNVASGIDWFYNSEGFQSGDSLLNANFQSAAGSIDLAAISGDWRVAMSFLEKKTKVRVLAKPFLIVRDGESANINAGDQVPTITQSSTSDTDRVTNSVQYVTTGIQVGVTPTINAEGLINLKVTMSSSAAKATEGFEVSTPTITNRTITTDIFSGDGQTVALGGLIREDLDGTGNQVPLLGSMPIIGKLFSSESDKYTRSELIMLITSRTIREVSEIDEFKDNILDLYSFPLADSPKQNTVEKENFE